MNWTDEWELREGMFYYENRVLWMYAGYITYPNSENLFGQKLPPRPDDWMERLYDIAKGGDVISRIRAITILAKEDPDSDVFNAIMTAWAFAQDYSDTIDVSTRVIIHPDHFRLLKLNAQNIWYRQQGGDIKHPSIEIMDVFGIGKKKSKPKSSKSKPKTKNVEITHLAETVETDNKARSMPNMSLPKPMKLPVPSAKKRKKPRLPKSSKK